MPNVFKTPTEILAEMLADYKGLTGIEFGVNDLHREEVIKMMPLAGALSMQRAELQRVDDDTYPASSSEEGLEKHLKAKQLPDRAEAQPSSGVIRFTGDDGVNIPANFTQVRRLLDGKVYVAIGSAVITGGFADVTFQSLLKGSAQNIDALEQSFQLITPISGVDASCKNQTQFRSGRDRETPAEMLERIQAADRQDDTGGNIPAYEGWAKEADDRVVTARALKNPRGAGTVDTVITAGTSDIAAAVEAGQPVLRLPSQDLVDVVQAYILLKNPTTDDHQTVIPEEQAFNITVHYSLLDEALRSSVDVTIMKLAKVFIYEARSGDVLHPTDLERRIDETVGHLIDERRVSNFGASPEYQVPNAKILTPGTITLAEL